MSFVMIILRRWAYQALVLGVVSVAGLSACKSNRKGAGPESGDDPCLVDPASCMSAGGGGGPGVGPIECPSAVICGTPPVCCASGQECIDSQCLPPCDTGVRCGADQMTCCAAAQVCLGTACVNPGAGCTDSFDCPEDFFCEPTLGKCLPQFDPLICQVTPVFGAFAVNTEVSITTSPAGEAVETRDCLQPISAPAVVDLDGDERPEIIVNMACRNEWRTAVLRAYKGNGQHLWSATATNDLINGRSGIAAADLDGDGFAEIVAVAQTTINTDSCRILAFRPNGQRLWASRGLDDTTPLTVCSTNADLNGAPTIADLDQDGSPEVIYGALVLDKTGKLLWIRDTGVREGTNSGYSGGISAVADIDADGKLEVIAGRRVYEHDGTAKSFVLGTNDGYPAIANFDNDSQPEIVLVASGQVSYFDGLTGALEWGPVAIPGGTSNNRGGPPTVADFDADGKPEIGVAGGSSYSVYDPQRADLTPPYVLWSKATRDQSSNATGSSVFDFEGDGVAEVVYQDECFVRAYRGTDGNVLLQIPNSSATIHEYPLVADVDADGNSEIVIVANNWNGVVNGCKSDYPAAYPSTATGRFGLFVYGDQNDQWVRTRRVWNQHAYHVTNITPQGTVPTPEINNWSVPGLNNYRQNVQGEGVFNAADLKVLGLDVVLVGCPSSLTLRARIGNGGSLGAPAGVPVAFRYGAPGSGGALIGVASTTAGILPGGSTTVQITVDLQGSPPYDFSATVNDDGSGGAGAVVECDGANNSGGIGGIRCGSFLL